MKPLRQGTIFRKIAWFFEFKEMFKKLTCFFLKFLLPANFGTLSKTGKFKGTVCVILNNLKLGASNLLIQNFNTVYKKIGNSRENRRNTVEKRRKNICK